jgi:hypothetical protein
MGLYFWTCYLKKQQWEREKEGEGEQVSKKRKWQTAENSELNR